MPEFSDEDKAEMRTYIRVVYDRLPQPDEHRRLAALFHIAAEESGLEKDDILRAMAVYRNVLEQQFKQKP